MVKLHFKNVPILFYQNIDPKRHLLALHDRLSNIRFNVFDATQKWETLDVQVFGPKKVKKYRF